MVNMKFSHPLQWPNGFPRTEKWEKSINNSFKVGLTLQEALTFVYDELNELGAKKATLFTDYENVEQPRSVRRVGSDNGAALSFEYNEQVYRMACDRWVNLEQNIYAIHLAIRNMRHIVLWGVGNVENVFGGYSTKAQQSAQPRSGATNAKTAHTTDGWRLELGLGPTATLDDAQAVYRRRAKNFANNQEELMKLNLAMDEATKALSL
ncbi:MAG: hypothetical protein MK052_00435 [Alphaproteobacteria bacterium]|nr:hypothetical protein [Alphaproteobacteria bacterium]